MEEHLWKKSGQLYKDPQSFNLTTVTDGLLNSDFPAFNRYFPAVEGFEEDTK